MTAREAVEVLRGKLKAMPDYGGGAIKVSRDALGDMVDGSRIDMPPCWRESRDPNAEERCEH